MNKRELMLSLINGGAPAGYTRAAFFRHFGPQYQAGQAAIDRYLQFFRHTGMDFVKVQFEQDTPESPAAGTGHRRPRNQHRERSNGGFGRSAGALCPGGRLHRAGQYVRGQPESGG